MSRHRHTDLARLLDTGIVGIIRGAPAPKTVDVVDALAAGGVDVVEVTADTDGALETISRMSDAFDRSEVLVEAGTVLDAETAGAALRAGAKFIITPSFDPDGLEADPLAVRRDASRDEQRVPGDRALGVVDNRLDNDA